MKLTYMTPGNYEKQHYDQLTLLLIQRVLTGLETVCELVT
ncbi:Uncharacterized protein dnm_034540 [Desulfonema magnum]|uniref:Uncharacterized protein n=1 Tax=Desulfonema magnum TaxID=45655 RepID=A0A975BKZ3_9BACT|nr:Uncharacterized protein dnm_034540 [Desulfonema magnum]